MYTTETESIRHQATIAALPFVENRATAESAQTLRDELLYQRATQTYLWALPLIKTLGMQRGSEQTFGAGYNILPVWKKRRGLGLPALCASRDSSLPTQNTVQEMMS